MGQGGAVQGSAKGRGCRRAKAAHALVLLGALDVAAGGLARPRLEGEVPVPARTASE